MRCSVVGDEAEFEIGTSPCALRLVFTESGLQALMSEASGALEKRRAR
ncbi:MAG: hypothetical protein ACRDRL_09155 [Sciscionella sp.]